MILVACALGHEQGDGSTLVRRNEQFEILCVRFHMPIVLNTVIERPSLNLPASARDHIGEQALARGDATGSRSDNCDFGQRVRRDRERVHHPFDAGQWIAKGQRDRLDASLKRFLFSLVTCKQAQRSDELDSFILLDSLLHLFPRDGGDALPYHVTWLERAAKDERGQDERFGDRVIAFDIGRGIGLGIASGLGLRERCGIALTGGHGGQNVVGGAIEDAAEGAYARSRHTFAYGADDRSARHDRCFHTQLHTVLLGQREEFIGGQRARAFVRGDNVHALREGRTDMAYAGLRIMQVGGGCLDEYIRADGPQAFQRALPVRYAGMGRQGTPRGGKLQKRWDIQPILAVNETGTGVRNADEGYVKIKFLAQQSTFGREQFGESLAHGAKTNDGESKAFHMVYSLLSMFTNDGWLCELDFTMMLCFNVES